MAAVTPHLLGLPREIRNHIYSYLFRDFELIGSLQVKTTKDPYHEFSIRVRNAPLLNVLLSHSQLRNEYMSADCCRKTSVLIHWGSSHFALSDGSAIAQTSHRMRVVLAKAKHVTVSIMAVQPTDLATLGLELTKVVTSHVHGLHSLRMVFWLTCQFVKHQDLSAVLCTPFATTIPNISIALPPSVAGLPMTRYGRGFHVGYTFQAAYEWPTPYLSHKVSYITAYYYGSSDSIKHNWSGKDLVDIQRPLPYQRHALEELPENIASALVRQSALVLEWKEWLEGGGAEGTLAKRE
jgi:hypothetical protein